MAWVEVAPRIQGVVLVGVDRVLVGVDLVVEVVRVVVGVEPFFLYVNHDNQKQMSEGTKPCKRGCGKRGDAPPVPPPFTSRRAATGAIASREPRHRLTRKRGGRWGDASPKQPKIGLQPRRRRRKTRGRGDKPPPPPPRAAPASTVAGAVPPRAVPAPTLAKKAPPPVAPYVGPKKREKLFDKLRHVFVSDWVTGALFYDPIKGEFTPVKGETEIASAVMYMGKKNNVDPELTLRTARAAAIAFDILVCAMAVTRHSIEPQMAKVVLELRKLQAEQRVGQIVNTSGKGADASYESASLAKEEARTKILGQLYAFVPDLETFTKQLRHQLSSSRYSLNAVTLTAPIHLLITSLVFKDDENKKKLVLNNFFSSPDEKKLDMYYSCPTEEANWLQSVIQPGWTPCNQKKDKCTKVISSILGNNNYISTNVFLNLVEMTKKLEKLPNKESQKVQDPIALLNAYKAELDGLFEFTQSITDLENPDPRVFFEIGRFDLAKNPKEAKLLLKKALIAMYEYLAFALSTSKSSNSECSKFWFRFVIPLFRLLGSNKSLRAYQQVFLILLYKNIQNLEGSDYQTPKYDELTMDTLLKDPSDKRFLQNMVHRLTAWNIRTSKKFTVQDILGGEPGFETVKKWIDEVPGLPKSELHRWNLAWTSTPEAYYRTALHDIITTLDPKNTCPPVTSGLWDAGKSTNRKAKVAQSGNKFVVGGLELAPVASLRMGYRTHLVVLSVHRPSGDHAKILTVLTYADPKSETGTRAYNTVHVLDVPLESAKHGSALTKMTVPVGLLKAASDPSEARDWDFAFEKAVRTDEVSKLLYSGSLHDTREVDVDVISTPPIHGDPFRSISGLVGSRAVVLMYESLDVLAWLFHSHCCMADRVKIKAIKQGERITQVSVEFVSKKRDSVSKKVTTYHTTVTFSNTKVERTARIAKSRLAKIGESARRKAGVAKTGVGVTVEWREKKTV